MEIYKLNEHKYAFSSPFLETFFQFAGIGKSNGGETRQVFVPFLGDFLSIIEKWPDANIYCLEFSSPFLGTFFQ